MMEMFHTLAFCCLSCCHLVGVFADSDAVKSVSVTEGDSVTLESGLTEIQKEDIIMWRFGRADTLIAQIDKEDEIFSTSHGDVVGFRDRLKLDHQTGSLTIMNTRTTDSGLYQITIKASKETTHRFRVTVYARLSVPVISNNASQCSSSSSGSSSQQNCSLVCSAVNVGHVTLSWYKGNSLLSSISVSDLSISLSLPLEVEYQDKNSYSCVINNPISNQTTHLDITQLCQPCAEQSPSYPSDSVSLIVLVSAAVAGSLLMVAAVRIFCICRKHKKTYQQASECYRG
uniref:Ig-like domain-containing protein n=1 Tax=Cyprinus carpio TaxID=7962 RepID=A0A8C1QL49_CYPCA